jgi:hypothetical protein
VPYQLYFFVFLVKKKEPVNVQAQTALIQREHLNQQKVMQKSIASRFRREKLLVN